MKRNWGLDELIEHFTFLPNEMQQVGNKSGETRMGFAVLFKFFQFEARFPTHKFEVPKAVIQYIAKQIETPAELYAQYDWAGRSITYHRTQIREFFGFREDTIQDAEEVIDWLCKNVLFQDHDFEHLVEIVYRRFREIKVVPPTPDRIERLIRAAIRTYEEQFFQATLGKMPTSSLSKLDSLVERIAFLDEEQGGSSSDEGLLSFQELKSDPGKPGVESVLREVSKLRTIRNLELPDDLFRDIPLKVLTKYRQRTATEDLRELRRHPDPIRYTLLAAFFRLRSMEITDNLIELLIQIVHRIGVRAERKVEKEILNDLRKVSNKYGILFNMAQSAINNPDGVIRDVIFPVVNEQTLRDLIKEFKHTGPAYREKIHTIIRASYGSQPEILQYDIPMAEILRDFGRFFHVLFLLVIYGEIFTTLIGNVFGISRQIQSLYNLPKSWLVLGILLASFLISQAGFTSLLTYLYPLFGYMGLILLIFLAAQRMPRD